MFVIERMTQKALAFILKKMIRMLTLLSHSVEDISDSYTKEQKREIYNNVKILLSEQFICDNIIQSLNDGPLSKNSHEYAESLIYALPTKRTINILVKKLREQEADRLEVFNQMLPFLSRRFICNNIIKSLNESIEENKESVDNDSMSRLCRAWINSSPNIECAYSRIKPLLFKYTDVFASQEGEDILLRRLMKQDYYNEGFYVDVGAYHPFRFSTTLHYYLLGWSGLNIDPTPSMKENFDNARPRDINVQAGVALSPSVMQYHMFKEPAFNTFSADNLEYAKTRSEYNGAKDVKTCRLDELLDTYLPENQHIMFFNIDVEGLELDVLNSNNWSKYRPKILLVENITDVSSGQSVEKKLKKEGYIWVAQTKNTNFYMELDYYNIVK